MYLQYEKGDKFGSSILFKAHGYDWRMWLFPRGTKDSSETKRLHSPFSEEVHVRLQNIKTAGKKLARSISEVLYYSQETY